MSENKAQKLFLNEAGIMPELHLSEGGNPTCSQWYLDNGASNHMTGDLHKFIDLNHNITGKVRFGDDSAVSIQGRGTIVFQGKHGEQWVLSDVYYIPSLRSNLISLGQLTELGHKILLDDDELEVVEKHSDRVIMRVPRAVNRVYKIELRVVEPVCLMASVQDKAWLWHGRLGHVNFRSPKQLVGKGMATGVPAINHPEQVVVVVWQQSKSGFLFLEQLSGKQMRSSSWSMWTCVDQLHQ
jgi:hypothetical protein